MLVRNDHLSFFPGELIALLTSSRRHRFSHHGLRPLPLRNPIILHKIGLIEDFRLYRRRHDYDSRNVGKEWEPVLSDETCYRLVKGPDISVHVAKHESFLTLRPGEEAGFIASRSLPSYVPQPQK
jgi:hypothetical protein